MPPSTACAITACIFLLCSAWQAAAQRASFEVASIKVNKSGGSGGSLGPRGNTLNGSNVTPATLVQYAYSLPGAQLLNQQIVGGPDWFRTERFDIQARAEGEARIPAAQLRVMLQLLLEDRFRLKLHRETRELPVYNLVLMKDGPKPSEDQTPPDPSQRIISFTSQEQTGSLRRGGLTMVTGPVTTALVGVAISIPTLVMLLQGQSDRMIFDKTGFDQLIDLRLEFRREGSAEPANPNDAGSNASPSLFTAIRDIGLRLAPAKAALEVVVIDSVQRPSEN